MSLDSRWLHSAKRQRKNINPGVRRGGHPTIPECQLGLWRRNHDSRQNSALRANQRGYAFARET